MWTSISKYLVVGMVLILSLQVRASGVYGVDTRKPGYDDPRFNAVARLEGPAGYCSGVLIAPQYVLTAAHCRTVLQTAKFEQKFDSKKVEVKIDHTWVGLGWLTYDGSADPDDIAIAHLAAPAPSWAAPIDLAIPSELLVDAPAIVLGYPADKLKGRQRTLSSNCSIRKLVRTWLTSDCGIQNGNSGGPLLIDVHGVLKIAAVASMSVDCGREFCFAKEYTDSNPNYFTNVSAYLSRIEVILRQPLPTSLETL